MTLRNSTPNERPANGPFLLKPIARSVKSALLPGLILGLQSGAALAAPTGGAVATQTNGLPAGHATITQSGALTTINQTTHNVALNWQTFNVAKSETVRFNQPSATASALNRIFDQNPSEIFGQVKANGRVVLMNPNGVFFKPGAKVNVGSLVAGAMQVGVDDFMSGNYKLEALKDAGGRVVNQGRIEAAPGGDVTLVGQSIANEGVIVATAGKVNLVAGEQVTVDFDGDGLLRFTVDKAVIDNATALDDQISHTGEISADGGDVLITASAADSVFRNSINNAGVIKAARIDKSGGSVRLVGLGPQASVLNTGVINASAGTARDAGGHVSIAGANVLHSGVVRADATGGDGGRVSIEASDKTLSSGIVSAASSQGAGGTVHVLGDRVGLVGDALVDVSGDTGGGEALVGGDFQGANASVRNATETYVGADTRIRADAGTSGDGGKVIVWADGNTRYFGDISTTGGSASGDGGNVEVSGKQNLTFDGGVDASAANGERGTLLLDPDDLHVTNGGTPDTPVAVPGATLDNTDPFTAPNGGGEFYAEQAAIETAADSASVTLLADGSVLFDDDLAGGSLELTMGGSITATTGAIDTRGMDITTEGAVLILTAGTTVTTGALQSSGVADNLAAGTGSITVVAGTGGSIGDVKTDGAVFTVDVAAGTVTQSGTIDDSAGAATTSLFKSGAGTLALSTVNTYTGTTTVSTGTLQLGGAGVIADGSSLVVDGGTFDLNGNNETVADIAGTGGALTSAGAATLSSGGSNADTSYSGDVTGAVALTKTGSGTLTLSGTNTYTGATTVSDDGTFQAGAASGFSAASAVTLNNTATLDVNDLSVTIGSLTGGTGTLDLGLGGDLSAAGNIDLTGMTVAMAGDGSNTIDSTGGTLTTDAITKTDTGDLSLGGDTAIDINGDIDVQDGSLVIQDDFTADGDLDADVDITFQGTSAGTFDNAGDQNITASTGNITDTAGAVLTKSDGTDLILTAGGDIGVNAGNRLGLAISGGGVVQAAATGSDIFMESASDLVVEDLATGAGADTVDIATTGTAALTMDGGGGYTDVSGDTFDLSAGGTLTFQNRDVTVTTLNASFGQGGGAASVDIDVDLSGSTTIAFAGGGGDSTLDLAGRGETFDFTATGPGAGNIANGLVATYTGIDNITSGSSNSDSFAGNDAYTINGADTGTASSLNGGAGVWDDIENLIGTAGDDTFNVANGGSLSGTIDGLGDATVDTLSYAAKNDATVTVTLDDGATTAAATAIDGGGSGGVSNVEAFVGSTNGGNDTFTGRDEVSTWTIDGAGGNEQVTDATTTNFYAGFEVLQGNGDVDNFNVTGDATFAEIRSGSGDDVFSVTGPGGGTTLTADLFGEGNNDTFEFGVPAGSPPGTGEDSHLDGSIDGGGGTDTIDFSGSDLLQVVTGPSGGNGTILTAGGDPDLISGTYTSINTVIDNGLSAVAGPDAVTFWFIDGVNSGTWGDSLANIGDNVFASIGIVGGNMADTFIFDPTGQLTGGVDGGAGTNTLMGSIGADLFTVMSGTSVDLTPPSAGVTSLSNIANLDSTAGAGDFPDVGVDTFNLNGNTWTGAIDGGAGANILSGATNYIVTGADLGTSTNVGGGWQNIQNLNATAADGDTFTFNGGSSLTGVADGLDGTDSFLLAGNATADTLRGGDAGDSFDLAGFTLTGDIDGGGGAGSGADNDTLIGSDDYTITGTNSGTSPDITGTWTDIENLTGTAGDDSFAIAGGSLDGVVDGLGNAGGGDTLSGDDTYSIIGANTGSASNLNGGAAGGFVGIENLSGTGGVDTFTVAGGALSGTADGLGNAGDTLAGDTSYTVSGSDSGTSASVAVWQNIENLIATDGDGDTFTFNGGSSLTGIANGLDGTDSFLLAGNAAAGTLRGGAAEDTFDLAGFTFTGTIDGSGAAGSGADSDTLIGSDDYTISGGDSGTSGDIVGTWTEIENLTGTAGDDSFAITAGSLTGIVDGLAHGAGGDLLSGDDTYTITGVDTGTASNLNGGGAGGFVNVENLTGTAGDDLFTISGGSLSGGVDGLGEAIRDRVAGDTTYVVTGVGSGSASSLNTGALATDGWTGIERLIGTAGPDSFTFNSGGQLAGDVLGQGGDDNFIINGGSTGTPTAAASLRGEGGNDTFTFNGATVATGRFEGDIYGDGPATGNVADQNTFFFVDRAHMVGAFNGGEEGGAASNDNDLIDVTGSLLANTPTEGAQPNRGTFATGNPVTDPLVIDRNGVGANDWFEALITPFSAATIANLAAPGTDVYWLVTGLDSVVYARTEAGLDMGGVQGTDWDTDPTVIYIAGGAGDDFFIFGPAGELTNQATGGGGTNTLMGSVNADQFLVLGGTSVQLTITGALVSNLGSVDDLNKTIGTGTRAETAGANDSVDLSGFTWDGMINLGIGTNTLIGAAEYTVTGADSGTSLQVTGGWLNVQNLTGRAALDDAFNVTTGTLSGTADGLTGTDTLAGNTTYSITGGDSGTAGSVAVWQNFANLSGTGGMDTFTVAGGTLSGTADGLGGVTDTLSGNSTYNITGADSGTANSVAVWQNIENLSGTAGIDTFTVAGGSLSGTADGLGNVGDSLSGNTSYTISGINSGTANDVAVWQNIGTLNGTGGIDTFTFTGGNLAGAANGLGGADVFNLDAAGSASALNGDGGNDSFNLAAGINFTASVNGGDDNDTFTLGAGGALSGVFDGGSGGTDMDTLIGDTMYTLTGADTGIASALNGGGGGGYVEVENLSGTAGMDTFTVTTGSLSGTADGLGGVTDTLSGNATYTISGGDSGTASSVGAWQNIENLTGRAGAADAFNVTTGSLSGTADGLTGNDTLSGNATYTISGANSGTASAVAVWQGIENLTGRAGAADAFNVTGAGTLSGTADGLSGTDTLSGNGTYTISGADSGTSSAVAVWQNIENLTGRAGLVDVFNVTGGGSLSGTADGLTGIDTLTGNTTYTITGADSGTASSVGTWQNIENLTGTAGVDSFDVTTGSLSGTADGLGASDTLSGNATYTITGANSGTASSVAVWQNIENLTGRAGAADAFNVTGAGMLSGTADGLTGTDTLSGNATYTISGADSGTATSIGTWQNIENLTGRAALPDAFNVTTGSLSGTADGLTGIDTLSGNTAYNITGADSGTANDVAVWQNIENLDGTAGMDTFTVAGGTLSGTADGLGGATDLLTGDMDYTVAGVNAGTSTSVATWTGIENLTGTAGMNTFTFNAGTTLGGTADGLDGANTFNFLGGAITVGAVTGGADVDTVSLTGGTVLSTTTVNTGGGDDVFEFGNPAAPGTDTSRLVGSLDLAGGSDTLDFSGIVASGLGADLITGGTFAGVNSLIGNNSQLIGLNVATAWLIDGVNSGQFAPDKDDLNTGAAQAFVNFSILAGTDVDTFFFTPAGQITGTGGASLQLVTITSSVGGEQGGTIEQGTGTAGIDAGAGSNVLVGSPVGDTFTLVGNSSVDLTVAAGTTSLLNIQDLDSTISAANIALDAGDDIYSYTTTNAWNGFIKGGAGSDTITFLGAVVSASQTATITAVDPASMTSATNNFTGTGGFDGIEILNTGAGDDSIILTVQPADTTDANQLNLGAGANDRITSQVPADWLLNGNGTGFVRDPGNVAARVAFSGVDHLNSNGASRLTFAGTASVPGVITAPSIALTPGAIQTGANGLNIVGDVTTTGTTSITATGGGGIFIDGFLRVTGGGSYTSNASGGALYHDVITDGAQTYNGATFFEEGGLGETPPDATKATVQAGGDLRFNGPLFILGRVVMRSSTDVFDFNADVQSAESSTLSIEPTASRDLFIDLTDGPGHIAANRFGIFDGSLSIGGEFVPDAANTGLLEGTLASATADYITISEPFPTSGNLLLVGSTIEMAPTNVLTDIEIKAGEAGLGDGRGDLVMMALGREAQAGNDGLPGGADIGNITAPAGDTVRLTADRAMLVATGQIENATNMIMNLQGGEVLLATGPDQQSVDFNVQSNATASTQTATSTNLVSGLANIFGVGSNLNLIFSDTRANFPNPAAVLTILQAVSFVDASLFEEDLSLFGVIGDGIAKSLDQCEDAEGCAPSVTEAELAEFIATLNERISRLEGLIESGEMERAEGEKLLAGYRDELQNFMDYQQQLRAYVERQEADDFGDEFGDEFDDVFEAEEELEPAVDESDAIAEEEPVFEEPEAFEEAEEEIVEPLEEAVEQEIPVDEFEDVEEAIETFDDIEEPAPEPATPEPGDGIELEDFDDDFDELEEELEEALLNGIMKPGAVNQLTSSVRIGDHGQVLWSGDVVLPTLHRRF